MSNQYYSDKDSVQEYIQMAKDVNGADLIEVMKPFLKGNSSLLELGSGPGSDYEILKKEYNVTGSDFSSEFINHLTQRFPEDTFLELDAITLNTELHFDAIYSNKVLQHLQDDELSASVIRQAAILNYNGIISHSFWKGEGQEKFKGMLVNYQTEESLKEIFSKCFDFLHIGTYKEFEDGDSLLLIARKKN